MSGVVALPMILMQCNAVISLLDDDYYDRAWCAVEVKIIQSIKKSHNVHSWYEHRQRKGNDRERRSSLQEGPLSLRIVMADKLLTVENDRSKVLFLERQCRLLE